MLRLVGTCGILFALAPGCRADAGERCGKSSDCRGALVCVERRCRTADFIRKAKERFMRAARQKERAARVAKKRARVAARRREARLLAASGVAPARRHAERPAGEGPGPDRPGQIRVSRTRGKGEIFAACHQWERLISGGCRFLTMSAYGTIVASYPSHQGAKDTLGARWNCRGRNTYVDYKLEAYALCQRLLKGKPAGKRAR